MAKIIPPKLRSTNGQIDKDYPGLNGPQKAMYRLGKFSPNYGRDHISLTEARRTAESYGIFPLNFWLENLNDTAPRDSKESHLQHLMFRHECAKAAAPYVHRKMPIGIDNGAGGPINTISPDALSKLSEIELEQFQSIMFKLASASLGTDHIEE